MAQVASMGQAVWMQPLDTAWGIFPTMPRLAFRMMHRVLEMTWATTQAVVESMPIPIWNTKARMTTRAMGIIAMVKEGRSSSRVSVP